MAILVSQKPILILWNRDQYAVMEKSYFNKAFRLGCSSDSAFAQLLLVMYAGVDINMYVGYIWNGGPLERYLTLRSICMYMHQ